MTNWMDSAQAHHQRVEYEQQRGQRKSPEMPATEEDALRAYKYARAFHDRKRLQALEELANAQGWESLAEYKSRSDARRAETVRREAIHRRDAEDRASQLASRSDAIELHQRATKNGDKQLASAIKRTAKTNGWNLMPTNANDLAAQIHTDLQDIVTSHDQTSATYRDNLRAGRITSEYVQDQISEHTNASTARLQQLRDQAAAYVAEAQADYDSTYTGITSPQGDTSQQLLDEIRGGKAWDRMQRELNSIPKEKRANEVINRISTASPEVLRVLITEAPSYLAAQGIRDADTAVRAAVHAAQPQLKEAEGRINEAIKLRDLTTYNAGVVGNRIATASTDDVGSGGLSGYVSPDVLHLR